MKKLLSLVLAIALCMAGVPALANTTDMISMIAVESGVIETVDNGVHLAGRTPDFTADAYLNTHHILGEKVSDFTWSFEYTPTQTDWNTDKFMFRANEENEWSGYGLMVQGNQLGAKLSICKGEAWNDPYVSAPYTLEWNQTYNVRIQMEGADVKVWFDKAGAAPSEAPLMAVTVPNGAEYRDLYIADGDFQIISWAGNFVVGNMNVLIGGQEVTPTEPGHTWYPNNTIGLAGLSLQEADPSLPASWHNVVPVDLTAQGRHTYSLVASDRYYIGVCHVDVQGDEVTVSCEIENDPYVQLQAEYGRFFTALDQINARSIQDGDGAIPFGTPLSIQNDLGGADTALLFIRSRVTYCLPLAYDEVLADYWRNTPDMQAYRASLAGLMSRIPAATAPGAEPNVNSAPADGDMTSRISLETGVMSPVENGVRLAGRTPDESGDAYLNSWNLLGRPVKDFVWTFDYTPSQVDWNHDKFAFRCAEENEWNMYALYIKGGNLGACIDLSKGEAYTEPYATAEMWLDWEVTYTVRIEMIGQTVKVWMAEKDEFDASAAPVLEVTVPNVEGSDVYTEKYVPEGDFQIFSWAGQFVVSNMTIDVLD